MKYAIRFSPKARSDLDEIWTYTARQWGRQQADDYVRAFAAALTLVAHNPAISRDAAEVRPGLLKYPAGSHMLFFRLRSTSIDVVRILHQRMDFSRHL